MNKLVFLVFFLLIVFLLLNNTKQLNKIHQNTLNVEHELFQSFQRQKKSSFSPKKSEFTRKTRSQPRQISDKHYYQHSNPDKKYYHHSPDKQYYHISTGDKIYYQRYPPKIPISTVAYYPVSPPTTVVVNPEYSPSVIATQKLYSDKSDIQIGTISNLQDQLIMPLFKRPSPTNRDRYNYYTITNGSNGINPLSLPVYKNERSCMESMGCTELYDNDIVFIPQYNRFFRVNIF